jgi:hypothetical protein
VRERVARLEDDVEPRRQRRDRRDHGAPEHLSHDPDEGPCDRDRRATAAQLERVDAHVAAFVAEVEPVGLPAELARRYVHYDFIAITVAVRERYDQTPGPHAGARV